MCHGNLGNVLRVAGRLAEAEQAHRKHIALATDVGDTLGMGKAHSNLGNVLVELRRYEEAEREFEKHLTIIKECSSSAVDGLKSEIEITRRSIQRARGMAAREARLQAGDESSVFGAAGANAGGAAAE